jgi:hypothetical protein
MRKAEKELSKIRRKRFRTELNLVTLEEILQDDIFLYPNNIFFKDGEIATHFRDHALFWVKGKLYVNRDYVQWVKQAFELVKNGVVVCDVERKEPRRKGLEGR